MEERSHRNRRYIAVVASTAISLACGTNYAYSAWAPQFAERMQLSATQSNLIGASGNVGMYASGIPLGYMVDAKGPRPGVLLGGLTLGLGYFPIMKAYDAGPGSMSVVMLCFFGFMTGFGSCSAFQAAIKTSALNWPLHRGTATAFPLSAFGLSAFFFTAISSAFFHDDTSKYLLLLALGTSALTIVSFFFMYVPTADAYHALSTSEDRPAQSRRDSSQLSNSQTWRNKLRASKAQDETATEELSGSAVQDANSDETSSLLSDGPGDIGSEDGNPKHTSHHHHSHRADISGFSLLKKPEFYSIWVMLGILSGIGLMTINNIGNDTQALWYAYDGQTSKSFIISRQLIHVSLISISSFVGRLLSGIGSDILVKRLKQSRFWCLIASAAIFAHAQVAALKIENPHYLWIVSSLSGLGYGALFGVYPALVADTFGVSGLSVNWGFMTLAPVVWGNVFNLAYGSIFDAHSKVMPSGDRVCEEGLQCYRNAYWFTFLASIAGMVCSFWCVWHERHLKRRREGEGVSEHIA
ncbi:MFS transporter-like protein [Tothia fuscella]|uniref:MFS transporter-like protein n=1 Tax=Tothia fuscella TaxID=1048955 RepID=A0A9P4NR14_9PEZI|nr:MFS transporter-like protein [Tothia fuscella]